MTTFRAYLFGKFRIQCGEATLRCLEYRKPQELFSYLLMDRNRPHTRDALANVLWSESDTSSSRRNLRQALWQLQSVLDFEGVTTDNPILVLEKDWIQLNPHVDLWLDVSIFERAYGQTAGLRGWELDSEQVKILEEAVNLYQGDFLEGWYQDWCLFERVRLRNMFSIILDKLMGYCEAQHEYEAGIMYGDLILRNDQARERTHRRLMRLHYLRGDRTMALRQYKRGVVALRNELGVQPSRRTQMLYEQIRAESPGFLTGSGVDSEPNTDQSWGDLCIRLKQLRSALADLQQRVQKNILAIDEALNGQR